MTPIHIMCSKFTDIVRRDVFEAMRCFRHKKFAIWGFSMSFCARSAEDAKRLQGSVVRDHTSLSKTSSQSAPICWSYFRKSEFVVRLHCLHCEPKKHRNAFWYRAHSLQNLTDCDQIVVQKSKHFPFSAWPEQCLYPTLWNLAFAVLQLCRWKFSHKETL